MEVKLQKIEIQNFLSVTTLIEFEFQNGIDIVSASNGSGKSSIFLDSICFALYGSPYRNITLKQLINRSNKNNLLVRLQFQVRNDSYVVVRGLAPQLFDLIKNGEVISNLPSVKENQKFLEESVLKTNLKLFKSIVLLNSEFFKGWLSMSSKDRTEIMEHITNFGFFKRVKEIASLRLKDVREGLGRTQFLIDTLTKQIEDYIQKQQEIDGDIENQIQLELLKLEKFSNQLMEIQSKFDEFQKLTNEQSTLEDNLRKMKQMIEINVNHTKGLTKIVCPNCQNEFYSKNVDEIKQTIKQMVDEYQRSLSNLKTLSQNIADFGDINETYYSVLNERNQSKTRVSILERQKLNMVSFDESIKEVEKQIEKSKHHNVTYSKKFDILTQLMKILKGDNVQTYLRQQLQTFNSICNSIYSMFYSSNNILISIDSSFNVTIIQGNAEINANSLSSGEKARVSFSILFAFIKFLEMKNSICWNVLVMDEVLDGFLDYSGREALFQILSSITNKNLIIITHNSDVDNISVEFNRKINIVNKGGSKFL